MYDIIITKTKNGYSINKKQRPEIGDLPSKKPKSLFYKPEYSSGNGTRELEKIFGTERVFSNPKPLELIKDFLEIGSSKESVVLDFFAGSGTTLHALMKLNEEDGGNRKCILVTNNESDICENVTYKRCLKVIEGFTNEELGDFSGLSCNSLRYYRTDFIPRNQTVKAEQDLVVKSTDMLCIKENLYNEEKTFAGLPTHPKLMRYFNDGKKHMLVLYREEIVPEIVKKMEGMEFKSPLIIYTFSTNNDPHTELFVNVMDKVRLTALPKAIREAYKDVLPEANDNIII